MKKECNQADQIILDIEGKIFKTSRTTLCSIPGSVLSSLNKDSMYFDPKSKTYNFDRDSSIFKHILAAYRIGEIHVPRNVCPKRFKKEIEFWGIPQRMIPSCCWKFFYEVEDDINALNTIIKSSPTVNDGNKVSASADNNHTAVQSGPIFATNGNTKEKIDVTLENKREGFQNDKSMLSHVNPIPTVTLSKEENLVKRHSGDSKHLLQGGQTLRDRIWYFLEEPQTSTAAKVWCFAYVFVVMVSVVLNIFWVDEDFRVEPYLYKFSFPFRNKTNLTLPVPVTIELNTKLRRLLSTDPHLSIFIIDIICTVIFGLEMVVHFVACKQKHRYLTNAYNVIKVFMCTTMAIACIGEVRKDIITNKDVGMFFLYLKTMNMFRILLILRLRKLYNNFHIILLALEQSGRELSLLMVVFGSSILVYAGVMFCVEIETEMFPNTRTSMWWALITMTTIGYGDYYPTTTRGYFVGALCAINGLIVVALPIAAIASNFSVICSRNADYRKHLAYIRREEVRMTKRQNDVFDNNSHDVEYIRNEKNKNI